VDGKLLSALLKYCKCSFERSDKEFLTYIVQSYDGYKCFSKTLTHTLNKKLCKKLNQMSPDYAEDHSVNVTAVEE